MKDELLLLLSTMDIPKGRLNLSLSDVHWLLRNVQVRNSQNKDINRVMQILKIMVKNPEVLNESN